MQDNDPDVLGAATDRMGVEEASVLSSVLGIFSPASWDLESFLISYWWVMVVCFVVVLGVCEYVRQHWQAWCDRRRLRTYQEQCHVRKMLARWANNRNGCLASSQPTDAPPERDGGVPSERGGASSVRPRRERSKTPTVVSATGAANLRSPNSRPVATADNVFTEEVPPCLPSFSAAGHTDAAVPPSSTPVLVPTDASTHTTPTASSTHHSRIRGTLSGMDEDNTLELSPQLPSVVTTPGTDGEQPDSNNSSVSKRLAPLAAGLKPSALLSRFAPTTTPISPGGLSTDGENSSLFNEATSLSTSFPITNYCCPRYSADEQRHMEERRQKNEMDWNEARRALENTKAMSVSADAAVSGESSIPPGGAVTSPPGSSVTRRRARRAE